MKSASLSITLHDIVRVEVSDIDKTVKTITLSLEDDEEVLEEKNKFLLDRIFDLALSRICKQRRFSG